MRFIVCLLTAASLTASSCGGEDEPSADGGATPTQTVTHEPPKPLPYSNEKPLLNPPIPRHGRGPAKPGEQLRIKNGLTVAEVIKRLGKPREYKPLDWVACKYWKTTDEQLEIRVCFSEKAVRRVKSSHLLPARWRSYGNP